MKAPENGESEFEPPKNGIPAARKSSEIHGSHQLDFYHGLDILGFMVDAARCPATPPKKKSFAAPHSKSSTAKNQDLGNSGTRNKGFDRALCLFDKPFTDRSNESLGQPNNRMSANQSDFYEAQLKKFSIKIW